jgi:membrane-bound metal-dependent hydrolase YbcI (DUF457 family)
LLAIALVGIVLGLDLAWALLGTSPGSLAFGLVDEPAHLATAALALLALTAVSRDRLPTAFLVAVLLASVAIDLDHLPGYLGWDGLTGSQPRPYPHSLVVASGLFALGMLTPRRYRPVALGLAFGILVHLLRDSATGPGAALAWPLEGRAISVPYAAYATILVAFVAVLAPWPFNRLSGPTLRPRTGWLRTTASAVALVAALSIAMLIPTSAEASSNRKVPVPVAFGVYLPGADRDPSLLDAYTGAIGHPPAIVHVYRSWSELPFDAEPLDAIWERGAAPMVTWEPWGEFGGTGIPLWEIASGSRDAYIAEAARQAAAWGGRLFVRFGHEMNGDWYPWGSYVGENTPAAYKAAWRQVVAIFRREGAGNVRWVWTPYVHLGKMPFKRYYPGDQWVDWAGLDGFNWGGPFMSFRKIFDESYKSMVRLTAKPLMIAETGSVEAGGSKATWIRRALRRALPRYRQVRALLWFSDVHPRGADWRVDSSPDALYALRQELQAPRYNPGRDYLFAAHGVVGKR